MFALEAAARLTGLDSLSEAVGEIRQLTLDSVALRQRAREAEFVVSAGIRFHRNSPLRVTSRWPSRR